MGFVCFVLEQIAIIIMNREVDLDELSHNNT